MWIAVLYIVLWLTSNFTDYSACGAAYSAAAVLPLYRQHKLINHTRFTSYRHIQRRSNYITFCGFNGSLIGTIYGNFWPKIEIFSKTLAFPLRSWVQYILFVN